MEKRIVHIVSNVLLLMYLVAVFTLCFIHSESLPSVTFRLWGIPTDKIVHFIMFLPFTPLAYLSIAGVRKRRPVVLLCIAGMLLAGITEVLQGLSGYRAMELGDFAADCLGLVISTICIIIVNKLRNK